MKKNDGYTLVEMSIVISIIVLFSGMAMISLTVLNSASAKDSAVNFDTDVATLATKSRSMDANFTHGSVTYTDYCIVLFKDSSGKSTYQAPGYYDPNTDTYLVDYSQRKKLSRRVEIKLDNVTTDTGSGYSVYQGSTSDVSIVSIIRYNRRGECVLGYGVYNFCKRGGNIIATNKIRQNGSHETR